VWLVGRYFLLMKIESLFSNILFCVLLIIYPAIMLYHFYKNKRWVFFGILSIFFAIGLWSVIDAFYQYEIVGGICTIIFLKPLIICFFVNIACGIIHLISYLTEKFKNRNFNQKSIGD
jgi:hypothetical protein